MYTFHHSAVIADREELHGIARHLAEEAVLNDQPADGDLLMGEVRKVFDRAVRIPGNPSILIEGMPGDGEAEQFHFVFQPLIIGGFGEGDFRERGF